MLSRQARLHNSAHPARSIVYSSVPEGSFSSLCLLSHYSRVAAIDGIDLVLWFLRWQSQSSAVLSAIEFTDEQLGDHSAFSSNESLSDQISSVGKPHHARELPGTIGFPPHDPKQLGTQAFGCLLLGTFLHRVKISPLVSHVACNLDVVDVRHIFDHFDRGRLG